MPKYVAFTVGVTERNRLVLSSKLSSCTHMKILINQRVCVLNYFIGAQRTVEKNGRETQTAVEVKSTHRQDALSMRLNN